MVIIQESSPLEINGATGSIDSSNSNECTQNGSYSSSLSYMTHLECSGCGSIESCDQLIGVCKDCLQPFIVRYDLKRLRNNIEKSVFSTRETSLWRYRELLPIRNSEYIITLGEGMTPIWRAKSLERDWGLKSLYVKDESAQPTGTFKARGASVSLSRAIELGVSTVCIPSNGNAGSAWACYGARAGVKVIIAIPKDATVLAKEEAVIFGAQVYLVDGLINDCGKIIHQFVNDSNQLNNNHNNNNNNSGNIVNNNNNNGNNSDNDKVKEKQGYTFDVSTLKEPYRLEGKKTMGYEIAEQLGWELPDAIVYPTGGGVGLIAIHKAFEELMELGWVSNKKMPKFISVQATGCSPLKTANDSGKSRCEVYENAETIAVGIRVPKSYGDFMILDICNKTKGGFITVGDEEILKMYRDIPRKEGSFLCLEGAAAMAGLEKAIHSGLVNKSDRVVLINTGSGSKTPGVLPLGSLPLLSKDDKIPIII